MFPDLDTLREWALRGRERFAKLVCVGGDGTLDTAAVAAFRRSVPFLSVPTGFGNLFARALGHSGRVDDAIQAIESGHVIPVDVGFRNGVPFVCQESFGMLSDIQSRAEEVSDQPRARWRRGLGYYETAVHYLRDTMLKSMRVVVDGKVIAHDAAIVTVANVETYGGWLNLTPGASPIDGLFDVFVMKKASKMQVLGNLIKWAFRLPGARDAVVYRGKRVSITAGRKMREELDIAPRLLPVLVSPETAVALERQSDREDSVAAVGPRQVA
jgi:diacylglycerol kinase (ATP)